MVPLVNRMVNGFSTLLLCVSLAECTVVCEQGKIEGGSFSVRSHQKNPHCHLTKEISFSGF